MKPGPHGLTAASILETITRFVIASHDRVAVTPVSDRPVRRPPAGRDRHAGEDAGGPSGQEAGVTYSGAPISVV